MEIKMRRLEKLSIAGFVLLVLSICCVSQMAAAEERWVGTWASGQQLVNSGNYPASPFLANNTLRQIVHATIGGSRIRVQFSNKYSTGATTINSAHIALSNSGLPIKSSIDTSTDTALTFNNGSASVTMSAGQEIYSDPIDFNVPPLSNLTVSIYFGSDVSSTIVTGHPGSRTMYYLKTGNTVSDANMESEYKVWHWYVLSRIDVLRDDSYGCVVTLGDSITDGRGCDPNYNDRWPDDLAVRLQADPDANKVGVINQGIGANAVLSDNQTGGSSALNRFDHDVLSQPGVRWVIVFEGTNDICGGASSSSLISAYQTFINKAHANKILAYGATITPFKGYSTYNSTRLTVNNWIKDHNNFDAAIDFAAAVWDPADHDSLNPAYRVYPNPPNGNANDGLHFNAAGLQAVANAIDANLFKLTADLDKDGIVNLVDFAVLAGQWLQAPGLPSADIAPMLAGNGAVNFKDLFLMDLEWLEEE
jgi:lysophospholipase L1-like esterase